MCRKEVIVKKAKWVYQYTKGTRAFMLLLAAVVMVAAFCNVLIAFVLKLFLDVATGERDVPLTDVVLIAGGILVLGGGTYVLSAMLRNKVECGIEAKLRGEIMGAVFDADYYEISNVHTGEILTRLTEDTSAVARFFPCVIHDVVGSLAVALLAVAYLLFLNAKLTLILFLAIPVLIAVVSLFNFPIARADKQRKEAEERNRVFMQEQLASVKSIKTYHAEGRCLGIMRRLYGTYGRKKIVFGTWEGFALFLNGLIGNAMLLIVLGVGAYFVMDGQTTVSALVAIVQLLNYIVEPIGRMGAAVSQLAQAESSADRICDILDAEKDVWEPKRDVQGLSALTVKDVSFSYGEKRILERFSYRFSKNNAYCIVGENGSGKSTLLRILAGLYHPQCGEVTLTDELGQERQADVRSYALLVPADEKLFSASLKDNVTFFEPDADDEKVWEVVRQVNLSEFVQSLPHKLESLVTEGGRSLSSGQVQRIALSRMLYKVNDIVIMDEPTTNLDAESIDVLVKVISALKEERIVIIASHEEQIIRACDHVVDLTEDPALLPHQLSIV